jgi:hypothetical protein
MELYIYLQGTDRLAGPMQKRNDNNKKQEIESD